MARAQAGRRATSSIRIPRACRAARRRALAAPVALARPSGKPWCRREQPGACGNIAPMRIDVFCHLLPPRYLEQRNRRAGSRVRHAVREVFLGQSRTDRPRHPVSHPRHVSGRPTAADHCRSECGEHHRAARHAPSWRASPTTRLAELVAKHPDRFIAAAACLPMNDVDAALREADRAIRDLGFCGVEIFTDINGKPVDAPEFFPLYEKMQDYDLPILLHPRRTNTTPDYAGEADLEVSDLHELRLALRNLDGHGEAGVWRRARALSEAQDHHASRRRHGAVLSRSASSCRGTSTKGAWATTTTGRR